MSLRALRRVAQPAQPETEPGGEGQQDAACDQQHAEARQQQSEQRRVGQQRHRSGWPAPAAARRRPCPHARSAPQQRAPRCRALRRCARPTRRRPRRQHLGTCSRRGTSCDQGSARLHAVGQQRAIDQRREPARLADRRHGGALHLAAARHQPALRRQHARLDTVGHERASSLAKSFAKATTKAAYRWPAGHRRTRHHRRPCRDARSCQVPRKAQFDPITTAVLLPLRGKRSGSPSTAASSGRASPTPGAELAIR